MFYIKYYTYTETQKVLKISKKGTEKLDKGK